jgi:lantibiotic modifying enzyme
MEQTLAYISKTLMQYDVPDSGLFYGKMGIAIFFFHHSRFTGDKSYRDKAVELANQSICDQKSQQHIIINYANGLAGVGTGVEYLMQNDYVILDPYKAFIRFDKMIFSSTVFGDRADISLFTGLIGLGRYLLFRISSPNANNEYTGTLDNKMLLIHITNVCERMYLCLNDRTNTDVFRFLYAMDQANIFPTKVKRLLSLFSSGTSFSVKEDIISHHQKELEAYYCSRHNQLKTEITKKTSSDSSPGLYGGLAGIGLYILSILDKQHETWMKLL